MKNNTQEAAVVGPKSTISVGSQYLIGPAHQVEGIYTRYAGENLLVSVVCEDGHRVRLKLPPRVAARLGSRLVVRAAERIS